MNLPNPKALYRVLEATWPPASRQTIGPWTVRKGLGGGQRVSATTVNGPFGEADIGTAEQAMADLGQPDLFMIREDDHELDNALAQRGYQIKDPVTLYACPIGLLTEESPPPISAFTIWPPLHIMRDIWAEGGIGPGRIAVMERVVGAKTATFARQSGRPAGVGFVGIHDGIAMIHALEVAGQLRRKGAGNNMLRAAAKWAQDNGATFFSLIVTDANLGANVLYTNLGMTVVGKYHYRIKQKQ